jgi:hypothetical protein
MSCNVGHAKLINTS